MDQHRQIRANYTDSTVRVYQAYSNEIADVAVKHQRFLPPFSRNRMTWIKPSFLWMMYRSGWAAKAGQTRILAVDISREGFEWALMHSCLSHHEPGLYQSYEEWQRHKDSAPVRIQWDPERSITLEVLDKRAIQIGLGPQASGLYADQWVCRVSDVTDLARKIAALVQANQRVSAEELLPIEFEYPLANDTRQIIGATLAAPK